MKKVMPPFGDACFASGFSFFSLILSILFLDVINEKIYNFRDYLSFFIDRTFLCEFYEVILSLVSGNEKYLWIICFALIVLFYMNEHGLTKIVIRFKIQIDIKSSISSLFQDLNIYPHPTRNAKIIYKVSIFSFQINYILGSLWLGLSQYSSFLISFMGVLLHLVFAIIYYNRSEKWKKNIFG